MDQELRFYLDDDLEEDENQEPQQERILIVRLDKWLWAARFFKTRAIARMAVEKGHVFYNGERSSPNREVEIGAMLNIRMGYSEKTVEIKGLSTRRRNTDDSLLLFEETKNTRFASEPNSVKKNEYQTFPQEGEAPRERRPVRFLRRSVVRGEPRPDRATVNDRQILEYEMTD